MPSKPSAQSVASDLAEVKKWIMELDSAIGKRLNALEAPVLGATAALPITTTGNVWSGATWSAPRTSAESAQQKAVESARQVTRSCILAEMRNELNSDKPATLRIYNLSLAYANLHEATS